MVGMYLKMKHSDKQAHYLYFLQLFTIYKTLNSYYLLQIGWTPTISQLIMQDREQRQKLP